MNHENVKNKSLHSPLIPKCFANTVKIVFAASILVLTTEASAGGLFGKGGVFRGSVGNFLDGAIEKPILTPASKIAVGAISIISAGAHASATNRSSKDGYGTLGLNNDEKTEEKTTENTKDKEDKTTAEQEQEQEEFLNSERKRLTIEDPAIRPDPVGNALVGGVAGGFVKATSSTVLTGVATGAASTGRSAVIGSAVDSAKNNKANNLETGRGGKNDPRYNPKGSL